MQSNMAVGRLNKHVKRLEECSTSKKMSKKPLKKISVHAIFCSNDLFSHLLQFTFHNLKHIIS